MAATTFHLCEQVKSYLLSEDVKASLDALWPGRWTVEVRPDFNSDAADLDNLEISIIPGQINGSQPNRIALEQTFEMGVELRKRLDNVSEIPALAEFAEELMLKLDAFVPVSPPKVRGAALMPLSTASLYAFEEQEGALTYASVISMPVKYFYKRTRMTG